MPLHNRHDKMEDNVEGVVHQHHLEIPKVKTDTASERIQFDQAMRMESPKAFSMISLRLHMICAVGVLCSTLNGYDSSLLDGLLQNHTFRAYFHGSNDGIWVGIVSSLYQIGSIVGIPFAGPALDTWGRRRGIFIGVCIVIVGTFIQGTTVYSHSLPQFMIGRLFLGFGAQLATCGGPIYVIEMAHPAYRGVVTGLYNTFWFTGAITASGAVRGSLNLLDNQTWLVPVWLQLLCSSIIGIFILFMPESPRWLFVNGKELLAMEVITRYHGTGNPRSTWVTLQAQEYRDSLHRNGADKRWWDYRALFRNRVSVYRLACNLTVSVFGQWTGQALLGLLLSAVLDTAGIHSAIAQTNLSLGFSCLQFVMAVSGAFLVDRIGRRPLLLCTNFTLGFVWLGMAIASSIHFQTGSVDSARAILALIYMFKIVFSLGITPIVVLYPVEVLSFEMRAKGFAFSALVVNLAGLLNQFAWPVAFANIRWKTYVILMLWCFFQGLVIYLLIPETRSRTLEELDDIFEAKNPRKESLRQKKSPPSETPPETLR